MPAYMLVEIAEVLDADIYAEYRRRVAPTVYKYGGRYVVRGPVVPLSGDWNPARMILLEFPSMESLMQWTTSSDYAEVAPLRMRATRTRALALEGYDPATDPEAPQAARKT